MGSTIPEIQVQVFMKGPIPEVSNDVVEETWKILKNMFWKDDKPLGMDATPEDRKGSVPVIGKDERWGWYETHSPGEMKENEDTVYKHIQHISDCILKAAETTIPGKLPTARFRCRPTKTALSDTQNSDYRTDADMELVDSRHKADGRANIWDSVVNAQFNESNIDVEKINQVLADGSCFRLLSDQ